MASPSQSRRAQRQTRAQALDRLLRAERGRLLRQARYHSRRPEDAEDALNEACVQFLRFYDGPAGEDALRWMMLVVKRAAWAMGRKAAARESRCRSSRDEQMDGALDAIPDDRPGTAELAERAEETAKVLSLIERLKPDERTALTLFGLGCSYAEIRELRGWSNTKVNRCISEGRARVRELLERGDT